MRAAVIQMRRVQDGVWGRRFRAETLGKSTNEATASSRGEVVRLRAGETRLSWIEEDLFLAAFKTSPRSTWYDVQIFSAKLQYRNCWRLNSNTLLLCPFQGYSDRVNDSTPEGRYVCMTRGIHPKNLVGRKPQRR